MELLQLFITASIPVLKVLLITALGSFLALDRINILGAETRKHLNIVSCMLMTQLTCPSILFRFCCRSFTNQNGINLF